MEEDRNKGECPFCGVFVHFEGRGHVKIRQDVPTQAIGQSCPDCNEALVVLDKGGSWKRYPAKQPKGIPGVPSSVMQAFREAILSLDAGAPRAAACMVRRCVGSACSQQGVPDEEEGKWLPLQVRIGRIRDRLLPATYEAARAAKLLGDAGAHEEAEERLGDINEKTVGKTIAVVRQFLANLYELPEEIKQLNVDRSDGQS